MANAIKPESLRSACPICRPTSRPRHRTAAATWCRSGETWYCDPVSRAHTSSSSPHTNATTSWTWSVGSQVHNNNLVELTSSPSDAARFDFETHSASCQLSDGLKAGHRKNRRAAFQNRLRCATLNMLCLYLMRGLSQRTCRCIKALRYLSVPTWARYSSMSTSTCSCIAYRRSTGRLQRMSAEST